MHVGGLQSLGFDQKTLFIVFLPTRWLKCWLEERGSGWRAWQPPPPEWLWRAWKRGVRVVVVVWQPPPPEMESLREPESLLHQSVRVLEIRAREACARDIDGDWKPTRNRGGGRPRGIEEEKDNRESKFAGQQTHMHDFKYPYAWFYTSVCIILYTCTNALKSGPYIHF